MNLFDELCSDAKADLESGKFLQTDENKGDNLELNKMVDQVEKKMNEALNNAVNKLTQVNPSGESSNVPKDNQQTDSNTNNESEENVNGND